MLTCEWAWPACCPVRPIWGFWGAKFTKMEDSLPWTPMNRRAKFDAVSFILGGEIRNRTNKQTNKQTVSDIFTPCISECVDKKTKNGVTYKRLVSKAVQ